MSHRPKWWPLHTTNYLGVLNDNFLKTIACYVCVAWVGINYEELLVTAAAAALVIPYVLLSPLAGRWAVIYQKKRVVHIAKALEMVIMLLATLGFAFKNVWIIIGCIFLMGTQSCLFSPAKYGLIRDIGGIEGVPYGTGLMETVSFLGMLSGTLLASFLSHASPWIFCAILFSIAALGYACSLALKVQEIPPEEEHETIRPFKYLADCYKEAGQYTGLNRIIAALSVFWFMAAIIQMTLLIYCRRSIGMTDMQTGWVLTGAAIGTGIGCFLSGKISGKVSRSKLTILSGTGVWVIMMLAFLLPVKGVPFGVLILLIGFCSGLFKVPFDSAIIEKVPGRALGRMLAYSNQVSFLFILAASGAFGIITKYLDTKYVFLFLAVVMCGTTLFVAFSKYLWRSNK